MANEGNDIDSDLPDLGDIDLKQLLSLDSTVLAHSIARIIAEAEDPRGAIAGFDSSI
ncbi:FXSXX-COOH protein [Nonomuraea sp. FMUSA5-5]|uniref:FXSXX-COOH protein n=1 Tax=Nonomuraea composti TaxID=2720023 RepID=A0ABX1AZW3_9ACTN|nr:FxSxx-COOH cyclophane-containing RiPP peptide [Nonomuraea sp. FMUSA5-5]NJP88954.1 FXSXX-COOH protein [Nonomuraea sp. FMUSA5-5]